MTFSLAGRAILVVDDMHAMRTIVRSLLNPLNPSSIIEAGDGQEALRLLESRRVDLVITDLNMSPMNGIELTKELRRPNRRLNSSVAVLMITGHRETEHVCAAIDAGVNDFLLKPLVPSEFQYRLEKIFMTPRPSAQSSNYKGPDRRRRSLPVRKDRRNQHVVI